MSTVARIGIAALACSLAACPGKQAPDSTAPATTPAPVAVTAAPATPTAPPAAVEQSSPALGGTSWRLVKIMSMDDTIYVPEDPSRYTLAFDSDGTVSVQADCNPGNGNWTSASESQLEFNELSIADAPCPTDSLKGQYEKQFPWVRSYIVKDGHLFLATMADGAIIEFEPAPR
jgi:para-nitrobenzyl esterase